MRACVCVQAYVREPEDNLRCYSPGPVFLVFETGPLISVTRLAGQWAPDPSLYPQHWDYQSRPLYSAVVLFLT